MLVLAIIGASELENKYGLDFCRSNSIISLFATVKPPLAPPSDFPKVPVKISTLPITPQYSMEPLPDFPITPVA